LPLGVNPYVPVGSRIDAEYAGKCVLLEFWPITAFAFVFLE